MVTEDEGSGRLQARWHAAGREMPVEDALGGGSRGSREGGWLLCVPARACESLSAGSVVVGAPAISGGWRLPCSPCLRV